VTTLTAPVLGGGRLRWALSDTWVLTWRNLTVWRRVPAYLVFTVVQPTIFTLLFRYVFGGAIPARGIPGGYVDFLLPGVIGQTAAFATMATAISLAIEAQKGVIDRLRVMPIARSAVLMGRLVADGVRMLITLLVIVAVGYAVGFRFHGGAGDAIAMVVLAEAFGLTLCCVSMFIGLRPDLAVPVDLRVVGVRARADDARLVAGVRGQPADHPCDQRAALTRPRHADGRQPVAVDRLAGRRRGGLRAAGRAGLQASVVAVRPR
jgi:ABC-type transport system involved in cytochrome c biogenesis permease component